VRLNQRPGALLLTFAVGAIIVVLAAAIATLL
jgi:hypothetical protein